MIVASSRDPKPRAREGENKPEERRLLILECLTSKGCKLERVHRGDGTSLERAVRLGVTSAAKLELIRTVHAHFCADPDPEMCFFSHEVADERGIVPYYFVRACTESAPPERQLAWHATDALTPIYEDCANELADDAAVCERAAALVARGIDTYALTTYPGHHASHEHYGGYCFVNNAVFIARCLR